MPVGGFLDSLPATLFVATHVIFLLVGLWAMRRAAQNGLPFSGALGLYVASQVGFLASFGGLLTLKMAVLIEQTLILILVLMVVQAKARKV